MILNKVHVCYRVVCAWFLDNNCGLKQLVKNILLLMNWNVKLNFRVLVLLRMYSIVMSPFSHDFLTLYNGLLQIFAVL